MLPRPVLRFIHRTHICIYTEYYELRINIMERIASRFKPNAMTKKNTTNIGRQHRGVRQKRKGQEKNAKKEEQKFARRKHFATRQMRERDIFSFSCLQFFIAMDSRRSWSLLGRSSLEREPPPLCAISSLFSFFLSLHDRRQYHHYMRR